MPATRPTDLCSATRPRDASRERRHHDLLRRQPCGGLACHHLRRRPAISESRTAARSARRWRPARSRSRSSPSGPAPPRARASHSCSAPRHRSGRDGDPTSSSLAPPTNSANPINVAVGVPEGTAPGDYPVTLSASTPAARRGPGRARSLFASRGGGLGAAGWRCRGRGHDRAPEAAHREEPADAGIIVLIGSTVAKRASVKLNQRGGKGGKLCGPRSHASRNKSLKVPGPVRVTLRARSFKAGKYGVTAPARRSLEGKREDHPPLSSGLGGGRDQRLDS